MDETPEEGLKLKAPKNCISFLLVPLMLSRKIRLGIAGQSRYLVQRWGGLLRSPFKEEGAIFRTRVEQGPCFDGTWDPPTPKPRGTKGHFVPMPADEEKGERSGSETRVIILEAGLNHVKERLCQQLSVQTGEGGVQVPDVSQLIRLSNVNIYLFLKGFYRVLRDPSAELRSKIYEFGKV